LGRIGDKPAIDELKSRFNKLYVNDNLNAERYIHILKSSVNPEAIDFIRKIYKNGFYEGKPQCRFKSIAMSALLDIGDGEVFTEKVESLYQGDLQPAEQEALCRLIRENIHDEHVLLKIVSQSKIYDLCHEALNRIKDINQVPEEMLIRILNNETITREILPLIHDTELLLKLLKSAIRTDDPAITSVSNDCYKIFDILCKEMKRRDYAVTTIANQAECHHCKGKGSFMNTKYNDFAEVYEDYTVRCARCKETGKIEVEDIGIILKGQEIHLRVYRNEKHQIDKII
jgi:hypothetical protein